MVTGGWKPSCRPGVGGGMPKSMDWVAGGYDDGFCRNNAVSACGVRIVSGLVKLGAWTSRGVPWSLGKLATLPLILEDGLWCCNMDGWARWWTVIVA